MVAEGNTFKSNLGKTPLPEIISTINQFKVSGMLEVRVWKRRSFSRMSLLRSHHPM